MIHEVVASPGRNNQIRKPRTVSATTLRVYRRGVNAWQGCLAGAARRRPVGQNIDERYRRRINELAKLVIVPTVRVIVVDNDSSVRPLRLGLQEINYVDNELLLIQGVGVACVTVLKSRRFQETYSRKVAGLNSGEEIRNVVLMIGTVALLSDEFH